MVKNVEYRKIMIEAICSDYEVLSQNFNDSKEVELSGEADTSPALDELRSIIYNGDSSSINGKAFIIDDPDSSTAQSEKNFKKEDESPLDKRVFNYYRGSLKEYIPVIA